MWLSTKLLASWHTHHDSGKYFASTAKLILKTVIFVKKRNIVIFSRKEKVVTIDTKRVMAPREVE